MEDAVKILILGDVLNIAYGLLTRIPAGIIRQNHPSYSNTNQKKEMREYSQLNKGL